MMYSTVFLSVHGKYWNFLFFQVLSSLILVVLMRMH
jgi:hypothetical protein